MNPLADTVTLFSTKVESLEKVPPATNSKTARRVGHQKSIFRRSNEAHTHAIVAIQASQ